MNLVQTLRRIGQQGGLSHWAESGKWLASQLPLIEKLYKRNGFEIKLTCGACPEQYEIFKDGKQVAYYRLRHGGFTVDYPDCGGETIYEAYPDGDGDFNPDERLVYLTKALRALQNKLVSVEEINNRIK